MSLVGYVDSSIYDTLYNHKIIYLASSAPVNLELSKL